MSKLDMTPGAQIPRTDAGPQTAVTQALSSAAYRDGSVDDFVKNVQPELPVRRAGSISSNRTSARRSARP